MYRKEITSLITIFYVLHYPSSRPYMIHTDLIWRLEIPDDANSRLTPLSPSHYYLIIVGLLLRITLIILYISILISD